MTDKLKPCPWCGKAPFVPDSVYESTDCDWMVSCEDDDCPVGPSTDWYPTREQAIAEWNNRKES
jgi:hypothetical protein